MIELARFATDGVEQMPNAYVEALPKGRPERSAIKHFGEGSPGPRARSFKSQQEAIAPLGARLRHLNDKTRSDQWRTT